MPFSVAGVRGALPEKSPQSSWLSHMKVFGMQSPFAHLNSWSEQAGVVQLDGSSDPSRQSSSPSQTHVLGMQRWLAQVKSHELGHSLSTGSFSGCGAHERPSSCRVSPYGQPHFRSMPVLVWK